jgi:hypothetical protein
MKIREGERAIEPVWVHQLRQLEDRPARCARSRSRAVRFPLGPVPCSVALERSRTCQNALPGGP